jgi:hypothetical protein
MRPDAKTSMRLKPILLPYSTPSGYVEECCPNVPEGWTELFRWEEHAPVRAEINGMDINARLLRAQADMMGDSGAVFAEMSDEMKEISKKQRPKPILLRKRYVVCDLHALPLPKAEM